MIIDASNGGTDWNGVAVVIAAVAAAFVTIGNAFMNWRRDKRLNAKVDAVATTVDGHSSEQNRKIDALSLAVASQTRGGTVPEQVAGKEGNAPVGIKDGVVTVERRDAEQRSTDKGEDK